MKINQVCSSPVSLSGFSYVTYGMTAEDVERRAKEKDFGKVGMTDIVETNKSKVTTTAIKNAQSSKWAKYVALRVENKDGKEVDFKMLSASGEEMKTVISLSGAEGEKDAKKFVAAMGKIKKIARFKVLSVSVHPAEPAAAYIRLGGVDIINSAEYTQMQRLIATVCEAADLDVRSFDFDCSLPMKEEQCALSVLFTGG